MQALALPVWVALSLYWLVAILIHLILTDPNPPTSTPKKESDSTQPEKPPTATTTTTTKTPPTLHEPFLVQLAINTTFLSLPRIAIVTLPAAHLTLLNYLYTAPEPILTSTSSPDFDRLCPYYHPHSPTFLGTLTQPTILGIVLVLLSAPLRLLCFHQLGSSFTFALTRPQAGLVKSGMYKYVRHPSYPCAVLSVAGFFLTFAAPRGASMQCFFGGEDEEGWGRAVVMGVCVTLAMAVAEMFRQRVKAEERFLQELFGEEWTEYAGRTKKLVPWVY